MHTPPPQLTRQLPSPPELVQVALTVHRLQFGAADGAVRRPAKAVLATKAITNVLSMPSV